MKTIRIAKLFGAAGLVLATAATFALAADAQYNAVGPDGIAASPKVRQALNANAASAAVATAKVAAMACPKCNDISVTEPNTQAKGGQILMGVGTKAVTKHTCGSCDSKLEMVGTGKATRTVATHTCTAAVAKTATCCGSAMAR